MANFKGDLDPITDFIGVTLLENGDQESLELWRKAKFDYYTNHDNAGYDDFYLSVGLRPSAYRSIGGKGKRE